jgi:hypothetical protein
MDTPTRAEALALLGRAVSRLATPHSMVVQQRHPETGELERRSVTRDPLIVILHRAVILSSTSGAGGGSDPVKVPLNSAAFEIEKTIRTDVERAWQGLAPDILALPKDWETHTALINWHTLWLPIAVQAVTGISDDSIRFVSSIFDHHRASIEDMLNPPAQITLYDTACPRCSKSRGMKGGDSVPALIITIDPLGNSRAVCRACDHVWADRTAVMQLKRDISDLATLTAPAEELAEA